MTRFVSSRNTIDKHEHSFQEPSPARTVGVKERGWRGKLFRAATKAVVSLILLLLLGELGSRVLTLLVTPFRSAPFRRYDPQFGVLLIHNSRVIHRRECFEGEVFTNQWGMRDRERSIDNTDDHLRVALLGDSIIEGVHVKPNEVVNIRMEKLLQDKGYPNAEVLNFGIAGIGTTQELLLYQQKVRRFHPDVVVLAFTTSNDVMNNSSIIQPKAYGIHTWYAPYYDLSSTGELIFRPVEQRTLNAVRSVLEEHSVLAYYAERIWARINLPLWKWEGIPVYFGVFGDPLDPEWANAWAVTERILALLKDAVATDGPKFIVLVHPEFYRIDPHWRERMTKQVGRIPPSFKPETSETRLRELAARNDIKLSFLSPYFESYRDHQGLTWPYFSLPCDPHYSALGHEVMAKTIVQELERNNVLPPASNPVE